MSFKVSCPGCAKSLRAQDSSAGQALLCPACGTTFEVPATRNPGVSGIALPAGSSESEAYGPADNVTASAEGLPDSAAAAGPPQSKGHAGVLSSTTPAAPRANVTEPAEGSSPRYRSAVPWMALGATLAGLPLLIVVGIVLSRGPARPVAVAPHHAMGPRPLDVGASAGSTSAEPHRSANGAPAQMPTPAAPPGQTPPASGPEPSGAGSAPAQDDAPVNAGPLPPASPTDSAVYPGRGTTPDRAGDPSPAPAGGTRVPATAPVPQSDRAAPGPPGVAAGVEPNPQDGPPGAPTTSPALAAPPAPATTTTTGPSTRPRPRRSVAAVRPPIQPVPIPQPLGVSDRQIEQSIRLGIEALAAKFDSKTSIIKSPDPQAGDTYHCGANALAVYALLQAGLAVKDERLHPGGEIGGRLLDGVKRIPIDGGPDTYTRGIRANCLALFNRKQDRDVLEQDVDCLRRGHREGHYAYPAAPPRRAAPSASAGSASDAGPAGAGRAGEPRRAVPAGRGAWTGTETFPGGWWDNSNTQYGVLGVWAGAEAGLPVPESYWEAAESHWRRYQTRSGGWGYRDEAQPYSSMTAAGIATLFVVRDQMDALRGEPPPVGRPAFTPELERAMRWWETGSNSLDLAHGGYSLYGAERVGLASGFKYFGKHDWYRVLAQEAIGRQGSDGGLAISPNYPHEIESAYALLFLSRGRHPILMNKLRFDGHWANRPRDVANLARYASRALERPLNWQVVDLKHEWHDWMDSPVLYLASHVPIKFKDTDYDKFARSPKVAG